MAIKMRYFKSKKNWDKRPTLLKLRAHSCRWVVEDGEPGGKWARFCGDFAQDVTRPYCPEHKALVYVSARPRGTPVNTTSFRNLSVTVKS